MLNINYNNIFLRFRNQKLNNLFYIQLLNPKNFCLPMLTYFHEDVLMELGKKTHHKSSKNNNENCQAYQDHDFLLII